MYAVFYLFAPCGPLSFGGVPSYRPFDQVFLKSKMVVFDRFKETSDG